MRLNSVGKWCSICAMIVVSLASSADAQPRKVQKAPTARAQANRGVAQKPMDALATSMLNLLPDISFKGLPTLTALQAKPSGIRWNASSSGDDILWDQNNKRVGMLAGGGVFVPAQGDMRWMLFNWFNPPGNPLGFDPVSSLKRSGFMVRTLYCSGSIIEPTTYYFVTKSGKRPTVLMVYSFDAPTAASDVRWEISFRLDGKVTSLREAQGQIDQAVSDKCPPEVLDAPLVSYKEATRIALLASQTSNGSTPATPAPPLPSLPTASLIGAIQPSQQWFGVLTGHTGGSRFVDIAVRHEGGKLTGKVDFYPLRQGASGSWPLTGNYRDGSCELKFDGSTYRGPCSSTAFRGTKRSRGSTDMMVVAATMGRDRLKLSDQQLPRSISYAGVARAPSSLYSLEEALSLGHSNGVIEGSASNRWGTQPLHGVAMDGTCTLLKGTGRLYIGRCDTSSYTGEQVDDRGKVDMTFQYDVTEAEEGGSDE